MIPFNYIILSVVVLLSVFIYRSSFREEPFVPDTLAAAISNFIKPDTPFEDYLDFLSAMDSRSYRLTVQDVFLHLRSMKEGGSLTPAYVEQYM